MTKNIRFIGLDVHGETIAVGVAEPSGEVRSLGVIADRPEPVRRLVKKLGPARSLRACYEAGPCGYVLYWQLTGMGVHCEVVAPTLVPTKPGDRVKTDRRDALKLARSYRSGDHRGGLVLPIPSQPREHDPKAPGQRQPRGAGDCLESTAVAALPLRPPRRTGQTKAAGRDGRRPRAGRFHLGRGRPSREAAHQRKRRRRLEAERGEEVEQSRQLPSVPRKGGSSVAQCDRALAQTRALSPRQLPRDHDHDGEPEARSANIRVINRRACRPAAAWSAPTENRAKRTWT